MADTVKTETEHTTTVHTHAEPKASLVSNTLAIVGFIIVIVIVLWGLFHIATLGTPWLSSLFGKSSDSIKVTVPANVTSGTAFAITWKYQASEQGTYAFLYQCKDVVHFQSAAGGSTTTIPCGAAFTLPTTNNTLTLTPQLSGTASTSVPLSIVFIPSATTSKQVQGSATVIVNPAATTPPVVTPPATTTPPVATTPPVTNNPPAPAGPADLSVQILSVVPDGAGGGIATFDISNEGLSSTGVYSFTAQLPMTDGRLYQSQTQSSLAPGDHVVNTLRFSQATSGIFSVVVDPGTKNEARTDNNYASRQVSMPYIPPTYPQQYPQYPYVY
ncbi:MAG: hypothetical protein Q7R90_00550 [bacterium]|nr:hypothetical protein [bacterium]